MERSRNKGVRSEDRTLDLMHQGRALADCATLAPSDSSFYEATGQAFDSIMESLSRDEI